MQADSDAKYQPFLGGTAVLKTEDLMYLNELVEAGKIERSYTLLVMLARVR